jgi:hypothetical protein
MLFHCATSDFLVKDMHYAEFAEDEVSYESLQNYTEIVLMSKKSAALLAAIKEYDANKWKVIGQKVGKPAKVRLRRSHMHIVA